MCPSRLGRTLQFHAIVEVAQVYEFSLFQYLPKMERLASNDRWAHCPYEGGFERAQALRQRDEMLMKYS